MEKRELPYTTVENVNVNLQYGKQYGVPLKTKKIELPYDPEISVLGTYLEKMETLIQ